MVGSERTVVAEGTALGAKLRARRERWDFVFVVCAASVAVACGGSSSSNQKDVPRIGGGPSAAGEAGNRAAGGTVSAQGGADNDSAGAPSGVAGESPATPVAPVLGAHCTAHGALACAGRHQKLTLLCSASEIWEASQTCPTGQFCVATAGPELGVCRAPDADCTARQPGEAFCGGTDDGDAMRCDADGLSANVIEHCDDVCADGKCSQRSCPDNLVYSCDPGCPVGPDPAAAACFALCPNVPSGLSPMLDFDADIGVKYAIALPAVPSNSKCSCEEADGALAAVAFRLPVTPVAHSWRLTFPDAWVVHTVDNNVSEGTANEYECGSTWPDLFSWSRGCVVIINEGHRETSVWLSTKVPASAAAIAFVELAADQISVCPK